MVVRLDLLTIEAKEIKQVITSLINWMGKINGKWMVATITIMSYDK
ncbi:hypothetical protein ACQBEH_21460 [Brevibacillus laterosporus]